MYGGKKKEFTIERGRLIFTVEDIMERIITVG